MNKVKKALSYFLIIFLLSACGIYSFDGASIDYDQTKTLSILLFPNETAGGTPNMGQDFTEGLREYFQRRTKLELVQRQGDLQLEGAIVDYNVRPQAIRSSGNNTTADRTGLMRLTIRVQAVFTNTKNEDQNFSQSFTFFADYDPTTSSLTDVEDQLIEEIFDQIYLDIYQASVAQW